MLWMLGGAKAELAKFFKHQQQLDQPIACFVRREFSKFELKLEKLSKTLAHHHKTPETAVATWLHPKNIAKFFDSEICDNNKVSATSSLPRKKGKKRGALGNIRKSGKTEHKR